MLLGPKSIFTGGWFGEDGNSVPSNIFPDGWWGFQTNPPEPPTPHERTRKDIKYYSPDSRCERVDTCYVPVARRLGSYVAPTRTQDR